MRDAPGPREGDNVASKNSYAALQRHQDTSQWLLRAELEYQRLALFFLTSSTAQKSGSLVPMTARCVDLGEGQHPQVCSKRPLGGVCAASLLRHIDTKIRYVKEESRIISHGVRNEPTEKWRFGTGDRWGWMARCWISNAAIIGSAVKSLAQELGPSVNLNNRER